ncbi:aprataxin and PNK-like factor [Argiope bruennichi]|uniref:aprataxin and PNK-like factor n=1 Tax=Argiope bruennichi TaxID=94029 RepID=UPI0024946B47|nr:aprataxin and PNK-like factor [Argiope bruennichi]
MSQITLKPLDDGQKAVEIPLGKTTIGRGPFLGCIDKKVSRNHAVLEVTSKGEVYLTPTHVNPCFYQPTADSPGQILKKDTPHKLENGDSFSLLPRAYRYQLIVVEDPKKQQESTDQNDLNKQSGKTNGSTGVGFEENVKDPVKNVCNEEQGDTTMTEKPFSKEDEDNNVTDKNHSKEDNNFSKKLADITEEKAPSIKENNEIKKEKEVTEKETIPPEENNVDDTKATENSSENPTEHSKVNDSSGENCVDADELSKPSSDKVSEENESTSHADSFPKNGASDAAVDATHEDKEEKSVPEENSEVKRTDNCEELQKEETLDMSPSKDAINEGEDEKMLSNRMEEAPPSKRGRKKSTVPKPPKEEKGAKRKAATDAPPKPKGRKKVPKFEFEPGEEGSSQRQVPGRTSSRTNRQTRQGLSLEDFIVSDDDEWQSDRSEPKQRRKRGSRRNDDSGSDWEIEHKKSKKPVHKFGSGSESGSDWGSHKRKKGGPRGRRRKGKATSEAGSEDEAEPKPSNVTKSDKPRIPCTYGKKCYRRNQNHIDQFSHPGDSDYTSEPEASQKNDTAAVSEGEDSSPKKECPYGENCFRKNPQHKKDFKHTKKVRPQREAAKQADKKTKSSRNSDEVDNYDLNDSFLNDDSDEYKPVDSGSDYESGEKMKRLAKAKGGKSKRGKKV